jgi:tetratricopeptide (TPR) repeat protein
MTTPFKQAEAIIWFGRAMGAARSGDLPAAKANINQLSRLEQELVASGDAYWTEQVAIQGKAAAAWAALGEHQHTRAIELMRNAADREERTEKDVAMENRLWPMRELLGELLLQAGEPQQALLAFEDSLKIAPNRFRSLAGAAEAAVALKNDRSARSYYSQLLVLAGTADSERPALVAARAFINAHPR